jgi:hypothetical protein
MPIRLKNLLMLVVFFDHLFIDLYLLLPAPPVLPHFPSYIPPVLKLVRDTTAKSKNNQTVIHKNI